MHTASRQFIKACTQQGVQLNEAFIEDLAFHPGVIRDRRSSVYASPMVRAIEKWAWIAETKDPTNTDHQIVDKPIQISQLPLDPIMHTVAGIANAALRPRIALPVFEHLNPVYAWATCRDAEKYWNEVFNRITTPAVRPRLELFTADDTIVALRKAMHNPSGYLLRPGRLGQLDYVYPAGSLIQLETQQDIEGTHLLWRRTQSKPKVTAWSDVTRVNYSRPSVYSVSGEYRRLHFGYHEITRACPCTQCVQRLAGVALRNASQSAEGGNDQQGRCCDPFNKNLY